MNEWEEYKDEKEITMRTEIRQSLEETRRKRDRFFLKYQPLFQPLLPDRNYITKLVEKNAGISHSEEKEKPTVDGDATMVDATTDQVKEENAGVKKDDEQAKTNGVENGSTPDKPASESLENGVKHEEPTERKEKEDVVPYKLLEKQPEG
jgi:hypothetical protein